MFGGTRGRMGVSLMLLVSAIVITTSYFGYTSLVDASEGLGDVMTDLADVFRVMEDASVVLTQQEWEFKDSIDGTISNGCHRIIDTFMSIQRCRALALCPTRQWMGSTPLLECCLICSTGSLTTLRRSQKS